MVRNFLAIRLRLVTSWTAAVRSDGVVVNRISVLMMLRLRDSGQTRLMEASICLKFRRFVMCCLSLANVLLSLSRLSTLRVAFIGFPTLCRGQLVTKRCNSLHLITNLLVVSVKCPFKAAARVVMPRDSLANVRLLRLVVSWVSWVSSVMAPLCISSNDRWIRTRLMPLARLWSARFPRTRLRLVKVSNLLTCVPMLRWATCLCVVTDVRLIRLMIVWQLLSMLLGILILRLVRVRRIVSYSRCLVMTPPWVD